MAVTEQSRHHMIQRLTEVLGEPTTMTLVDHLPPVGWGDVATNADLHQLEDRLALRFEMIDHRFAAMDDKFEVRFNAVDETLQHLDRSVDHRLEGLEGRLATLIHQTFISTMRWGVATLLTCIGLLIAAAGVLLTLSG